MKTLFTHLLVAIILLPLTSTGQKLKGGFEKSEYIEILKLSARWIDTCKVPQPERFKLNYRSKTVGLDNKWDLWTSNDSVAVISIRGTTLEPVSWLANFYAAMVPAKGQLTLSNTFKFDYHLADHPKAAVHVGWLISTAFLSQDILPKIDSCYRAGIKNFIVAGHSQGGGIAYLMTSYHHYLQKDNKIPSNIIFKTYCSAGPKPGNLYYAHDFELITREGRAFNIINSSDWVPEVPMSIQTLDDFNNTNPFLLAKDVIKKQKLPARIALRFIYNDLDKPSRKAQENYQKYLGKMASKQIMKTLPEFVPPVYYNSNNYVRTGCPIVLMGDENYFKLYPDGKKHVFIHHMFEPYYYLAEKLP